ncbi:MAG: hypothetical protein J5809_04195 [Selenomonadaceae bacterium]|nr:hypothetical protein [Selenomonadaceae bacterium]
MTARVLLTALMILIFGAEEVSAEEGFSLGEALKNFQRQELNTSVEARFENDEFILRYKKFSLNYSNFDAEKNLRYVRLNVDNEIISLMGSGVDWSCGVTGIAWKEGEHNFAPMPTVGVGIYLTVMPKTKVYTNFSGMSFGGRGHVRDFEAGVRYSPSKNFAVTAGYRHVDAKVRNGSNRGDFKTNGLFMGVRADF